MREKRSSQNVEATFLMRPVFTLQLHQYWREGRGGEEEKEEE